MLFIFNALSKSTVFSTFKFSINALVIILAIFVLGLVIKLRKKRKRTVELIEKLPGPPTLPLLGNAVEINVEHDELFQRLTGGTFLFGKKEGIFKSWLGSAPYVFISHPNLVEVILSSPKYIDKSGDYDYLRPWLGTGLLTSWGSKWRSRRKILTPTFHFKILEDFIGIFQEQSDVLVKKLEKELNSQSFNIFPYVTLCTLDIICETAMGRHVNAQGNSESDYVKAIYELSSIIQNRQSKIWLQPNWLFRLSEQFHTHEKCIKILHGFSNKVIKEKKEEKKRRERCDSDGKKKRLAFLDFLIEASEGGSVLSDEDIREEVDTFMFEGHDTTSAAVSWALFLIASDEAVEKKVMEELNTIFGDDRDRKLTMNDLNNMKYLERCIKEALRLYPSVPIMARHLKSDVRLGPYDIPAGTTAMIVTYMLHRNTDYFSHPDKFDPDRFLPENMQGRHPYAYIPFSAGPRNCIGQKFALLEEKMIVSTVLWHYKLKPLDRREDLTLLGELILRPKSGLNFKLEKGKELKESS